MLRFMRKHARWDRLIYGPEVPKYQDRAFLIILSIQEDVSPELRKRFELPLPSQGLLYARDLGDRQRLGFESDLELDWRSSRDCYLPPGRLGGGLYPG